MKRPSIQPGLALLTLALTTVSVHAQSTLHQPPSPLLRQIIPPASEGLAATMQYAVLPPGSGQTDLSALPGHRHPGHMLVYVLEGEVISSLDGGDRIRYRPGDSWAERPGQLHRILNPSTENLARLLVIALDPVASAQ